MSRAARTLRIFGKIIKLCFIILIVFINLLLIWRLFSTNPPKSMQALEPNDALVAAYQADPALSMSFTQEQRNITSAEGNYGYFSLARTVFIPEANQIQLVFRYNSSTLRATQNDFSLNEAPSRDEDVYDVSILLVTDLTPETDEDNFSTSDDQVKKTRVHPTSVKTEQTTLYNYRLFVFDLGEFDLKSVTEDKTLISAFVDVYYNGAIDYEAEPYGTLCIYDYITEIEDFKLTSKDKKAIKSYLISK